MDPRVNRVGKTMLLRIILSILGLLGIGLIGKETKIITSGGADILNKAAYYVALPALVFHSVYARPLVEIFSPSLLIGFCAAIFLTLAGGWYLLGGVGDDAKKSVSLVQSYHGNLGYMGLPVVSMALGEVAAGKASIILGLGAPVQIALTVNLLVYLNTIEAEIVERVKGVMVNPVLLSLIAGLVFSSFTQPVPDLIEKVLSLLSTAALPIALIGAGASIRLEKPGEDFRVLGSVMGLKLVAMPVLGWTVLKILGVGSLALRTGVLMLAMPAAVSTYVYASAMGGDEELASLNISFTTLMSLLTITILLFVLT